ncbi:mitochondrial import receptor subunit TOM20 homolog B-like [Pseudoliparis swirei]|uniref:mitochondrial import receptor subunit TOM20 homolog B-like n=1 Tax=Pseudoliparis swirei TaxID=2059687 RepID=UPI0024BD78A7|nr:mitochondrial import receptor subunit TOM20 homolog B-like [Pseudoliparis swirei]
MEEEEGEEGASCETPRVLVFTPRVCAALHRRLEKGVDHLTNAIAVCGQPQQLLQVLQQTLPPPVFQMLLTKLPSISQRIVSAQSSSWAEKAEGNLRDKAQGKAHTC